MQRFPSWDNTILLFSTKPLFTKYNFTILFKTKIVFSTFQNNLHRETRICLWIIWSRHVYDFQNTLYTNIQIVKTYYLPIWIDACEWTQISSTMLIFAQQSYLYLKENNERGELDNLVSRNKPILIESGTS